ncbi:adenylate cyclase [Metallosphaera sedula]|uniref:Adenylate cyclase n=1 Tax=Metallosphaera sedula TaxID=43687 RepID=A0A0K1SS83_9CREN|nr:adenylate cyclase [Metallosphaera sedula]AKV77433.1 adenylate cyclase [Metallosphaera sedula]AKV79685.1 adenylate cyclase [Metallosphaera sedula]AKV81930.1 adenylate cyclase [Metallosphaera sedula]AKV84165.1 adenylate cyclase [Metallosphaera sedula]
MIEREIKVKLNVDPQSLMEKLLQDGYVYVGKETQEDIYLNGDTRDFRKTDEALRIRLVNDKIELTYKGPKMGSRSKSREEITVSLDDKDSMIRILEKLGYREAQSVRKTRHVLKKGEFSVCIDIVEGLGNFVEIEGIDIDEEKLLDFFKEFKSRFGISGEVITKSYLELKVEKLASSSN